MGHLASLETRIATTQAEIRSAQRLRYRVFHGDRFSTTISSSSSEPRDCDEFDAFCDHLLVADTSSISEKSPAAGRAGKDGLRRPGHDDGSAIVATCRLLLQEAAQSNRGFYSAREFEVAPLVNRFDGFRFLELGRSCVLPVYRHRRTVELLWHGIWSYSLHHGIDVMIGCASFEGADVERHERSLSFLHHSARAPKPWRVFARNEQYVDMNRMPADTIEASVAFRELPPLIKGYLRLGCYVGDGAVIDQDFNSIDIFIVLPVADIRRRYVKHFGIQGERYGAAITAGDASD